MKKKKKKRNIISTTFFTILSQQILNGRLLYTIIDEKILISLMGSN